MELLWPGIAPDRARNRLSTELSYLVQAFEKGSISGNAAFYRDWDTVRLREDAVSTDLSSIIECLAAAGTDSRPLGVQVERFRNALEAIGGTLLEGIDEDWALLARNDLAHRFTAVALDLHGSLTERRGFASGISILHAVIQKFHTSEPLHLASIRTLIDASRYEEAEVAFEQYRQMLEAEFGSEPDFETEKLLAYAQAGRQKKSRSLRVGTGPLASFVGREQEIKTLLHDLATDGPHQIVTMVGIGGIGKTRLAREVANAELADGREVIWTDLTEVSESRDLLLAILRALAGPAQNKITPESVAATLHARRALLILDNAENVAEKGADALIQILAHASDLRILVTSRVPIQARGECLFGIDPLPPPPVGSAELTNPAIRLFVDRSEALRQGRYGPADMLAIAEICRRVAGIPLAIEVVASYAHILPPKQMVGQLPSMTKATDSGSASANHRSTLTDALRWSYETLPAQARTTFRALAVFHGPFSLNAATAVADTSDILNDLSRLRLAGLIEVRGTDAGALYLLLQPVNQFLRELWTPAEAETLSSNHAANFADMAAKAYPRTRGKDLIPALEQLDSAYADLIMAIDWLAQTVTLKSSNPNFVSVPASISMAAGSIDGTFTIKHSQVTAAKTVTITATFPGSDQGIALLTLTPFLVSSVSLTPSSVLEASPSQGSVTINAPAGPQGVYVKVSSNSDSARVLPTLKISAGATSETFKTTTTYVSANTTATITAAIGSSAASQTLTIQPPTLLSLTLVPSSIAGGQDLACDGNLERSGRSGGH